MDRPALPKEDLFDTSTMTFGEHLDELRRSLARAIVWLVAGALVALVFLAKPVVNGIQGPLRAAIVEYNADRSLAKLGYDPDEKEVQSGPLRRWMLENGMAWELIYVLPPELMTGGAQADSGAAVDSGAAAKASAKDESKATKPATATKPEAAAKEDAKASSTVKPAEKSEPVDDGPPAEETKKSTGEAPKPVVKAGLGGELALDGGTANIPSAADLSPTEMSQFLTDIPDPSNFVPQLQLKRIEAGLNSHQVEEPFMIYLKASFVIGAVIASPGIFYHLWGFVAAGLYPHERKYVYLYLPFSIALFIGGVSLAFFAVLSYVLTFLLDFNSTLSVDLEPRLSYYMSFVLLLPLGFGIAFQLPLVMLFLQRIGIFETSAYENSWRIAVLVIAFLSMILTPADPYSMILLMFPLVMLYFLGIGLCRFMPRGRGLGSQAYDPV